MLSQWILMLGKQRRSTPFSAAATTLIAKNTEIMGDVVFSDILMIEGKVRGNVYAAGGADAHIHVLEKGVVEGEIRVPTQVINGTVNGDVHSEKHIELAAKAMVEGDVHYALIQVVQGAQVNGKLVFAGETPEQDNVVNPTETKTDNGLAMPGDDNNT